MVSRILFVSLLVAGTSVLTRGVKWVNPAYKKKQESGFFGLQPIEINKEHLSEGLALTTNEDVKDQFDVSVDGTGYGKFLEYYHNVEVENSNVIVKFDKLTGDVLDLSGKFLDDLGLVPNLSLENLLIAKQNEQAVIEAAKQHLQDKYNVLIQNDEYITPKLLIRPEQNGELDPFYIYEILLQENTAAKYVIVNAITKEVLSDYDGRESLDYNLIKKRKAMGGNEIYTYEYDGQNYDELELTNAGRNNCTLDFPEYSVVDASHLTTYSDVRSLEPVTIRCHNSKHLRYLRAAECSSSIFHDNENGACSPLADLTFFLKKISEMFKDYTNKPMSKKITAYGHFGVNYMNAFFTVKFANNDYTHEVYFGDGNPNYMAMHPFSSSCVVVAHEVAHARVYENSRLRYVNETAALNEGFADIVGCAFDEYLNKNKNKPTMDLKVGDDFIKNSYVRDLCNPSVQTVTDFNNLPVNSNYLKSPHLGSGIFGKLACNLHNSFTFTLRDLLLLFDTAQVFWTPTMTFEEIGCGLVKAAESLNLNVSALKAELGAREINVLSCA